MKITRLSLIWFVALLGLCGGCSAPAEPYGDDAIVGRPSPRVVGDEGDGAGISHGNLWYRVSVGDRSLDVHVRLFAPPETTRFFLPGAWQGHSDYANGIRISGARGEDGPRFLTIDRRGGYIDINAHSDDKWIELNYRVDLAGSKEAGPFHPRFEDGVLVAYAPTFLVLPAQQILDRSADIPIDVHFPSAWKVMSTWALDRTARSRANPDNTVHGFLASDARELGDAFIVAGSRLVGTSQFQKRDEIVVGFAPRFEGDRAGILNLITIFVQDYRRRFGHLGPIRVFVDTQQGSSDERGGLGRRGGFVLFLPRKALNDRDTALVVAHEAFHLWNGHQIIPSPSTESETRWFKEGLTQWIAVQTACLAPSFGRDDALREIAHSAASYAANPAVHGNGPVSKLDRLRLPYDRGFLIAMILAGRLTETPGSIGIDDWIRDVATRVEPRGYDSGVLRRSLKSLTSAQPEIDQLWADYLIKNTPIDVKSSLRRVGLHYIPPTRDNPARAIPLEGEKAVFENLLTQCTEPR